MKHCQKCGNQLHDEAVVCPNCGCACVAQPASYPNYAAGNTAYQSVPYQNTPPQNVPYQNAPYQANPYQQPPIDTESSSIANCALIFAILMPIVGLICGIVGVCKYKTSTYKTRCIVAIIVSVLIWIAGMLILSGM